MASENARREFHMTADLDALISRVEEGAGEDRELDGLVAQAALGFTHDGEAEPYRKWSKIAKDGAIVSGSASVMIRDYTSSLDAVLSLMEAKLPGWAWQAGSSDGGSIARVAQDGLRRADGVAATPARALLAATLRALQETRHGG